MNLEVEIKDFLMQNNLLTLHMWQVQRQLSLNTPLRMECATWIMQVT